LRDNGIEPKIIEYLKAVPSGSDFQSLAQKLGKRPSEFVRKGEVDFKDNGIADILNNDEKMFKAMNQFPKIMERPIVVKGAKAAIGRPPENVLGLL
jgi:arsenate reductase (glutaredoxin)